MLTLGFIIHKKAHPWVMTHRLSHHASCIKISRAVRPLGVYEKTYK